MKFGKRFAALLAAGTAAALFLSGTVNFSSVQHVSANGPTTGVIGCVDSTDPTLIQFQALASAANLPANPAYVVSGNQLTTFSATSGLPVVPPQLSIIAPTNGTGSYLAVTCGAIFQDQDAAPNLIDGANIQFSLIPTNGQAFQSPVVSSTCALCNGGIQTGIAQILESNGNVATIPCGSAPAVTPNSNFETCQGGVTVAATSANAGSPSGCVLANPTSTQTQCTSAIEEPNPANVVHVGLRANTSFGLVGGNAPVISIQAEYLRLASYPVGAAGTDTGPSTLATGSYSIGLVAPTYQMTLTPTPNTIGSATGSGVGATITAALSRVTISTCTLLQLNTTFVSCPVINGIQLNNTLTNTGQLNATATLTTTPGAEPGVVTFNTTSGVFGNPAQINAGSQQIVSVHCGAAPANVPVFLTPVVGSPYEFSLTSCTSVSTTLYGGGQAGTAVVTAQYVADITGATATAATTVTMTAASPTVALTRGCNEVITGPSLATNAAATAVLALVNPSSAVVSVWQFNNSLHAFQALYFSTTGAPVDITAVGPNQSVFICVSGNATFTVQ